MRYRTEGPAVIQENVGADYPVSLEIVDFTGDETSEAGLEGHVRNICIGMDIAGGPMMKVVLYRLKDCDKMLVVVHHLVVDGVSWRILLEDISRGYGQYLTDKKIVLPPKTTSFKQWAEGLTECRNSGTLREEIGYWKGLDLCDAVPMPEDPEPDNAAERGSVSSSLSPAETAALLTTANNAYNTETRDLLLAALAVTLREWHGCNRTLIDLEGHGREPVIEGVDISRTVGWFTSLYPFVLELPDSVETGHFIKRVKDALRKVPRRGIGYGMLKYLAARDDGESVAFLAKPPIVFNYWGSFDGGTSWKPFTIAEGMTDIAGGLSHSSHALEISSAVIAGRMEISIAYDRRRFGSKSMERLCADYKRNILLIEDHCSGREGSEVTPGDLDFEGLSMADLDGIAERLSGGDPA